jgi:hypothetical protein
MVFVRTLDSIFELMAWPLCREEFAHFVGSTGRISVEGREQHRLTELNLCEAIGYLVNDPSSNACLRAAHARTLFYRNKHFIREFMRHGADPVPYGPLRRNSFFLKCLKPNQLLPASNCGVKALAPERLNFPQYSSPQPVPAGAVAKAALVSLGWSYCSSQTLWQALPPVAFARSIRSPARCRP